MEKRHITLTVPALDYAGAWRFVQKWLLPNPGTLILMVVLLLTVPTLARPFQGLNATSVSTIPYQGRLADAAGNPVTGKQNMEFRLYSVPAGGTPLWEEFWTGANSVDVSDGLFSVMLGSINTGLTAVVQSNNTLYLGVTIDTDSEMTPRVQLGSVPFSVWSLTVADGSVTAAKLANNAVTSAKVADGTLATADFADSSVTAAKIADGAVTSAKVADGTLATADFADGGVTTAKIADGSITNAKLAPGLGLVPAGTIVMWSGSLDSIPTGWALCNGANGTPDLRDRFVVAAGGSYSVGATGGAAAVDLSHSHSPGSYFIPMLSENDAWKTRLETASSSWTANQRLTGSTTSSTATSSQGIKLLGQSASALSSATENRPPYYGLAFIMKLP